jgi:hypothetical protein
MITPETSAQNVNIRGRFRRNLDDLTGRRYGKLIVIERAENLGCNQTAWHCLCDCGRQSVVRSASLKIGKTISCGCYRYKMGLTSMEMAKRAVYHIYKGNAKKQGRKFDLSLEDAVKIFETNCSYCGCPPSQIKIARIGSEPFMHNGIDRVNNNFGYTADNVVPCCKFCNRAKSDRSLEDFKSWIKSAYYHLFGKEGVKTSCEVTEIVYK